MLSLESGTLVSSGHSVRGMRRSRGRATSRMARSQCHLISLLLQLTNMTFRFRNVDLSIGWALKHRRDEDVAFTYDIACQFKKKFNERFKQLPQELLQYLFLPSPNNILFALPVWHGNVHEVDCEAQNSCKCQLHMGKTDGEGPERFWALLNAFAGITREQGEGARFDELEDIFDALNFLKQNGLGENSVILHYHC